MLLLLLLMMMMMMTTLQVDAGAHATPAMPHVSSV